MYSACGIESENRNGHDVADVSSKTGLITTILNASLA
jgi:hypothetical protein